MMFHLGDLIPVLLVFQSTIFVLVLFSDFGTKRKANRVLATFFLILGVQFFGLISSVIGLQDPLFDRLACVYGFAYGPLLFGYSYLLIYKDAKIGYVKVLHMIPFVGLVVSAIMGIGWCEYAGPLMYLSLIFYITWAIKEMSKYRKILKQVQSQVGQIELKWLQYFMIFFCAILLLDIMDQFIMSLDVIDGLSSIHLMLLLLINWMFYKGLKQPQLFLGISKDDIDMLENDDPGNMPKTPSKEEQEELAILETFVRQSQIFTESTLTIDQLANEVNIPSRRLSFLINSFLNRNFIGYINHFRIQMAKERLKNPESKGETISEIMYDVGFSSKSSFNTFFKNETGLTPSEFKRSLPLH